MKTQIFQHLPTLPKAGIFCPLPILCVAFRAFIPDRSVFRCSPLPCLSMFRPLVPMHKSAHSAAQPAAPPGHAPATPDHHTRQSQCPCIPAPTTLLHAQGHQTPAPGGSMPPHHYAAITPPHRTRTPHTPITPQSPAYQHPPSRFPHRPSDASARGSMPPHHYAATTPPHCTLTPHIPITPQSSQQIGAPALVIIIQPPPPHTQASKKDCPVQEQSFL